MSYRKSVFVVVYSKTKNEIKYLLLKRKKHWKGWEFVKGGVNNDETKMAAVKREVFEETGSKPLKNTIKRFNFHGRYNYKKILRSRPKIRGQKFSLYSAEIKKGRVKLDKKEHSGFKWADFDKTMKILTWGNQKKSLKMVNDFLIKGK